MLPKGKGLSFLVHYLAEEARKKNVTIRLEHVVSQIKCMEEADPLSRNSSNPSFDNVVVRCANGAQFNSKRVVVTVPLGVLKTMVGEHAGERSLFDPALPSSVVTAIRHLGMGTLEKVFLTFRKEALILKRLPVDTDTFYNLSGNRFRVFLNINRVSGGQMMKAKAKAKAKANANAANDGYVLMVFVSGAFANGLPTDDVDVVLMVLASLREIFGAQYVPEQREAALEMVESYYVTRWSKDPFSLGSYSHIATGALPSDYEALAQPHFNNVLHFAGEATCRQYPSCVHGALVSGERAAKSVSRSLQ
jgi:polyamine oxidase